MVLREKIKATSQYAMFCPVKWTIQDPIDISVDSQFWKNHPLNRTICIFALYPKDKPYTL